MEGRLRRCRLIDRWRLEEEEMRPSVDILDLLQQSRLFARHCFWHAFHYYYFVRSLSGDCKIDLLKKFNYIPGVHEEELESGGKGLT